MLFRWLIAGLLATFSVITPSLAEEKSHERGLADLGSEEVVELHRFIEDWSNGRVEASDGVYRRFAMALASDFVLVGPDGKTALRGEVMDGLRGGHGRWLAHGAQGGRIEIRKIQLRAVSEPLVVLSYEEWHFQEQRLQEPPRGRISTVLLRRNQEAPGGVEWLHLHEVWLP